MGSLDEIFEHDVKQTVLKTYTAILQYKFSMLQKEQDKKKNDELETEVFELIHEIKNLV